MALATEWVVVVVAMVVTDHPAEVSGFSLRFLHLNSQVWRMVHELYVNKLSELYVKQTTTKWGGRRGRFN